MMTYAESADECVYLHTCAAGDGHGGAGGGGYPSRSISSVPLE